MIYCQCVSPYTVAMKNHISLILLIFIMNKKLYPHVKSNVWNKMFYIVLKFFQHSFRNIFCVYIQISIINYTQLLNIKNVRAIKRNEKTNCIISVINYCTVLLGLLFWPRWYTYIREYILRHSINLFRMVTMKLGLMSCSMFLN